MLSILENFYGEDTVALIIQITSYLLAVLFALSIHEFAHAKVAFNQGDYTPKAQGRLTLNPFKHIDILGFICLIICGYGWAKPVQVNPVKFKEYRKGFFLVSIAGVITNLAFSFIFAGIYVVLILCYPNVLLSSNSFVIYLYSFFIYFSLFFATINLCLFLFNLIPVFPLDGFNVINSFTKPNNKFVQFMVRYGSILLFGLILVDSFTNLNMFSKVVNFLMGPIITFWTKVII